MYFFLDVSDASVIREPATTSLVILCHALFVRRNNIKMHYTRLRSKYFCYTVVHTDNESVKLGE
jgi:hypothetical protein